MVSNNSLFYVLPYIPDWDCIHLYPTCSRRRCEWPTRHANGGALSDGPTLTHKGNHFVLRALYCMLARLEMGWP